MKPQVLLCPQQSILLSRGLDEASLRNPSPLLYTPAYLRALQKAFSVIKNTSDSRPQRSNNGQTSQCDYRVLTLPLVGRQCALSECGRKAKKSKISLWSSNPWVDDPHHNSIYAIGFTPWSKKWFFTLKAQHLLPFILQGKKRFP